MAQKHDYKVRGLDAANWLREDVFHADVKRVLGFPDYYGNNMNAFNDCLSELDINSEGGYAIALVHFDKFFAALPDRAKAALDIIETNSRRFFNHRTTFASFGSNRRSARLLLSMSDASLQAGIPAKDWIATADYRLHD